MVSKDDPKDETPNGPDKKSSHEDNGKQRQSTRKSSSAASTGSNRSNISTFHFIAPVVPKTKQVRKKPQRVTLDNRKPSGPRDVEGDSHDRTEFNPIDTARKEVKIEIALAKPKAKTDNAKKPVRLSPDQITTEPLQIPQQPPDQISLEPIQQIHPEPLQQLPKPQLQLQHTPAHQRSQQSPPQHHHPQQVPPHHKHPQQLPPSQPPNVPLQHPPPQQVTPETNQQVLSKDPQSPKPVPVTQNKNQFTPANDTPNAPVIPESGDSQQPPTIVVLPPKRKSVPPPVPVAQPKEAEEPQETPTVVVYSPKPLKTKTSKSSEKTSNQPADPQAAKQKPRANRQVVINTPLQKQEIVDGPNYHATLYGPKSVANNVKFELTVAKPPQGTSPPQPPPESPKPKPPATVVVYRKPPPSPHVKRQKPPPSEDDEDKLNRTKSRLVLADYLAEFSKKSALEPADEYDDGLDEKTNTLDVLKKFGINDQSEALETLLDKDTVHFDFGGLMRQYYSYVLRSYCLINMHERYRGSSKFSNCFTAIDIAKVGTRDEEMEKYTKAKLRRLDEKREQLRQVAVDDDHYNYLKNLANNQATLLPLTIVQLINEQMAPVLEDIFRFYGKNLGTEHTCTKVAGFHYVRIRKRVSMYNNICGGSTLTEDLSPYYAK